MVRNYKPRPGHRQYRKYDPEIIRKALQQRAKTNESISRIAKTYQIAKSVLQRRIRNVHQGDLGGQKAFSFEREEHIIKYINACAPWQYNIQYWDLRLLIKFYLDKRPVISKRKLPDNLPGQELVSNFMKRHADTISGKIIQNLSNNGAITVEVVLSYFHELKMSTAEVDPSNIICYNDVVINDEIEKNTKENKEDKTDLFVMTAVSVSGEMLNPYILYKKQNCYEITRRSVSMSKQPKPRLNGHIFNDWFKSVILPYFEGKSGKKCLIGNYFSSRISADMIKICKEQNIDFIFLPDNSKHLTQPLDSLTQLIHNAWRDMLEHRITYGIQATEEKFKKVVQNIVLDTAGDILESLKKTGISPVNSVEVLKQLPDYNETTIEDVDEEFEKIEMIKTSNQDVPIKQEMEWNEEYLDDNFDEEIASLEEQKATENRNESNKSQKSKGIGKKTKVIIEETEWVKTDTQNNLMILDFKLSPVDFQNDLNEDINVESSGHILQDDETTVRSSRNSKLTNKCKFSSEHSQNNVPALEKKGRPANYTRNGTEGDIFVLVEKEKDNKRNVRNKRNVIDEETEVDPLSNSQHFTNFHATLSACENTPDEGERSDHRGNGPCSTQYTELLRAILTSVTRQEKLQERTVLAMEAQTRALDNIARLLERREHNSVNHT